MNIPLLESNHHMDELEIGAFHDVYMGIIHIIEDKITQLLDSSLGQYFKTDIKQESYLKVADWSHKNSERMGVQFIIINDPEKKFLKNPGHINNNLKYFDADFEEQRIINKVRNSFLKRIFLGKPKYDETEIIDKRVMDLEIEELKNFKFSEDIPWLDEIKKCVLLVPVGYADNGYHYSEYFTDNTNGCVLSNSQSLNSNGKLSAKLMMLNLFDWYYDTAKRKMIHVNETTNYGSNDNALSDYENSFSTFIHESTHLKDDWYALKRNINADKYYKFSIPEEDLKGDFASWAKIFRSLVYHLNQTELNAFTSQHYVKMIEFFDHDERFKDKIISNEEARPIFDNYIAREGFVYAANKVLEGLIHGSDEVRKKLSEYILALFDKHPFFSQYKYERKRRIKDNNGVRSVKTSLREYKPKEKIYMFGKYIVAKKARYRKDAAAIFYEALTQHNKDVNMSNNAKMSSRKRVDENYGYPAIMDTTSNTNSLNIMGYQYQILPVTSDLQQKPNVKPTDYQYIHIGSKVKSKGAVDDSKKYTGYVRKIVKNEKGEITALYILDEATRKLKKVSPDKITLVSYYNPNKIQKHNDPFNQQ